MSQELDRQSTLETLQNHPELIIELEKNAGQIDDMDRQEAALEDERRTIAIFNKAYEDIIRMRRRWSVWILGSIIGIIIFDAVIILGLGFNLIQFSQDYFVPVFVSESLVKTFGLAYIVVKFLFDHNHTTPPDNGNGKNGLVT